MIPMLFDCQKNDLEPFKCTHCSDYVTHFWVELLKHAKGGHRPHLNPGYFPPGSVKFDLSTKFRSSSGKFQCDRCAFSTPYIYNFKNHLIRKHVELPEDDWIRCPECSLKFKLAADMKAHAKKHTVSSYFQCDKCSYKTWKKFALKEHINRYHLDKWLQCDHCDFKTQRKTNLDMHNACRHQIEKIKYHIYECHDCEYTSIRKRDLERHVLCKHTNRKNLERFQCDLCSYKSIFKVCVKVHKKRVHERVRVREKKWYRCKECDFGSLHFDSLQSHVFKKHTDLGALEWLKCGSCEYRTKNKRNLRQHLRRRNHEKVV